MSDDKLYTIKKSTLVDIANAVREKTGSSDTIKVENLDDAVAGISGGGGGGVDLGQSMYFIIGSDSGSASYLNYSTDYGKTWEFADFGTDPYGQWSKSIRIEVNKGINMLTDSSGGSAKYGMILIKSSGVISNLTSYMSGTEVFRFNGISNAFILLAQDNNIEVSFTATFSGGGGAD